MAKNAFLGLIMQISNLQLLNVLNDLLQPEKVKDYCPNGLQVEGKVEIQKLITGVTATEALIDAAIDMQADAILVHHGYFWKGENPVIKGMKKRRLSKLLQHDINLYAYHLPLDMHPSLGNNAMLGEIMGIQIDAGLEANNPHSVAVQGRYSQPISINTLKDRLSKGLQRSLLHEPGNTDLIETVAWCTGGGQGYIELAAEQQVDAYVTGEVSEQTIHVAREMGIHFIAAGHHATERYGVKAVGEYLQESLELDVHFIDIDNPA